MLWFRPPTKLEIYDSVRLEQVAAPSVTDFPLRARGWAVKLTALEWEQPQHLILAYDSATEISALAEVINVLGAGLVSRQSEPWVSPPQRVSGTDLRRLTAQHPPLALCEYHCVIDTISLNATLILIGDATGRSGHA